MGTELIARRHRYIDWARGIAVLLMIEAHTVDSWTRTADRASILFRDLVVLGGFAAPLFLWLAGLSVVLSTGRKAAKTGSRAAAVEATCRRGLEIFILAFLFRLQAFVLSPGGPAIALFRVDILNVMGPAIVAAGLLWAFATSPAAQTTVFAVAAATTACATPLLRESALVNLLPTWVQWYVRPADEHTTFTLLPWAGFVFAGAAVGALIASAGHARIRKLHGILIAVGLGLVAMGFYTAAQPAIFANATFWTSSPTFFAIRTGVLTLTLSLLFLIDGWRSEPRPVRTPSGAANLAAPPGWLARLGRSSLFVYWIHVELVYGYATWPIHRKLPIAVMLAAYAAFSFLMYRAVLMRDGAVALWRMRSERNAKLRTA